MIEISIIIPTYNRGAVLRETLEALILLNKGQIDYEVIIADNNSNDDTKKIVESFIDVLPLKYIFEPKQGKNFALNSALQVIEGELVVFTDDDVTPREDWLKCIVESSVRWPNIKIFGGLVEPVFPREVSAKIAAADFSSYVFGRYSPYASEQIAEGTTPVGANCWFRRSLFDEGLTYNTSIGPSGRGRISGSEMELFHRLVKRGEKIVFSPNAVIFHRIQEYQLKLPYLLKRAYASGRGWVRVKAPVSEAVFLMGAPRHLYRSIVEKFFVILSCLIRGDNFYEPLMKIAGFLGCIREYRENRMGTDE